MLLAFAIIHYLLRTVVYAARCACSQTTCSMAIEKRDCYGEYCYVYRDLPSMPIAAQGCITTRQEIPSNFTCEENRKGGVFCVCKGDFCNSASLATSPVVKIPTIMCVRSQTLRTNSYSCRGHFCQTIIMLSVNKYGDLTEPEVYRYCDEPRRTAETSLRVFNSFVDTDDNICVFSSTISGAEIYCYCRTNYCNNETMPQTDIGNVTCYLWSLGVSGYCKGQYCYQMTTIDRSPILGCVSYYSPSGAILREDSVTVRDGMTYTVCSEDFCNGFPLKSSRIPSMSISFIVTILCFILINN